MAREQNQTTGQEYAKVTTLIEAVRADNTTQFGEIKKEFGGVNKVLQDHAERIGKLEIVETKREGVAEYLREHPNAPALNSGGTAEGTNSTINKELTKAIMQLLLVIGVLAAAILALKAK